MVNVPITNYNQTPNFQQSDGDYDNVLDIYDMPIEILSSRSDYSELLHVPERLVDKGLTEDRPITLLPTLRPDSLEIL